MDIAETSTNARGPEIRAIILDYGEVLCLRPTEKQLRRMADVFGIGIPRFETLYENNRRAYDRADLTPDRYRLPSIRGQNPVASRLGCGDVEQHEPGDDCVARSPAQKRLAYGFVVQHARRHGRQSARRVRMDAEF